MSATYPIRKAGPVRKTGKAAATKAAPTRPRLVVISTPRRVVARGPFIALVGLLMLGGLLSLLMLHTLAAQDAFRQTSLQQRLAALTDAQQELEQQVQADAAPDALQARAKALGMVPSTITGYHQRADGRTVAHQVAVTTAVATTESDATTGSDATTSDTSTSAKNGDTASLAKPSEKASSAKPGDTSTSAKHRHKKATGE